MNTAEIKLDLFRRIDQLHGRKLEKVYQYIMNFLRSDNVRNGKSGLLKLSGSMQPADAEEMLKIIQEGCEYIDENEW